MNESKFLTLDLSLGFQPEKRKRVYKILEWIRETRTTGDYQTLFELWSGAKNIAENITLMAVFSWSISD